MTGDQELVGDRYVLGDVLGRGGMAEVRRGVDTRLGRPVAIKRLTAELAADPPARQRFQREAKSAASLNHPNIVSVYDSGEDSDPGTGLDVPFIVMELVEGETLRDLLRRDGRLTPERALEISVGVLAALRHSHQAGIVHRDIKPANVMLTATGAVKVMDFGIARTVSASSTSANLTAGVLGTAQYLSPEQARGETADARSDLYGAGCLLYELLVGRPPFIGETALSIAYQHVRESPVPPSEVDRAVPAAVDAVVLKALAKEPAARYQSAAEMSADVGRALAGRTVHAGPASTPPDPAPVDDPERTRTAHAVLPAAQPPARARSRRGWALLVSGLVALLLAVGAFSLSQSGRLAAGREPSVPVPELVGSTRAEAGTRLRRAGLTARYQEVAGPAGATVGRVTGQTPEAGVEVTGDSVVTVRVNAGPSAATIPAGLVGADVDDVRERLVRLGFRNVRTEPDPDPGDSDPGEVLAIDPPAGTSVALTRAVVVSYAPQDQTSAAPREPDDSSGPSSTRSATPASPSASASPRPPTTLPPAPPTSPTPAAPGPTASSTSAKPNPGRPSATGKGQTRSSSPGPGRPSDPGGGSDDENKGDTKRSDDKPSDDKPGDDEAKAQAAADAASKG